VIASSTFLSFYVAISLLPSPVSQIPSIFSIEDLFIFEKIVDFRQSRNDFNAIFELISVPNSFFVA
jgi:hypothetical protein